MASNYFKSMWKKLSQPIPKDSLSAEETKLIKKWRQASLARAWQWTGFGEKKLWDFMQLLLVPALLAIGGFWLNQQAAQRQDNLNEQRHKQDQQLAEKKAQEDRQLADKKAQEDRLLADDKAKQDTLIRYLDQMADSLKSGLLEAKPGSEKFIIAQARTVTALQSLDRERQHLIIQFLKASGLSKTSKTTNPKRLTNDDKVLLYRAQMERANLSNSDLSGAILIQANLKKLFVNVS